MNAEFALTREEIRPVKMRENKEYLSCSCHKKDYITPCTSKQMSLLLKQLAKGSEEKQVFDCHFPANG